MKKNNDSSLWQKEFAEFASAETQEVPSSLSSAVIEQVRQDLRPSAFAVFTKLVLLQALVGAATLLICPQFGVSFTSSMGLMHYLMQFGPSVCMLGCGAFFTGASLLVASALLRPEEIRAVKEKELLQLALLSTLSLGALLFAGGEMVLSLALIWALGSILGGALTLEAGWTVRRLRAARGLG